MLAPILDMRQSEDEHDTPDGGVPMPSSPESWRCRTSAHHTRHHVHYHTVKNKEMQGNTDAAFNSCGLLRLPGYSYS
jgi:hypothetical protein